MSPRFPTLLVVSTALLTTISLGHDAHADPGAGTAFRLGRELAPAELARNEVATSKARVCGAFLGQRAEETLVEQPPVLRVLELFDVSGELVSASEAAYEERRETASALSSAALRRTGAELPMGLRASASYAATRHVRLTSEYSLFSVPGSPATKLHEAFFRVGLAL